MSLKQRGKKKKEILKLNKNCLMARFHIKKKRKKEAHVKDQSNIK